MIPLPPEAIVDGAFMDSASIVESIRSLIEGLRIKTKNVAVSISGHSVYIKIINVPNMSEEQLEESIRWEAEQQIPFDIEDVNLDFQILNEQVSPDQMAVLLVAAKKDMINDYTAVIEEAGLQPAIVDVDVFAIENAYNLNFESSEDELIALLNRLHETKHISFILTTHEVDIVPQLADSVYMLVQGGQIVEHGTPRRLFSRADLLARSNIEPPMLAKLFETLRDCGLDVGELPMTVDEAAPEWKGNVGLITTLIPGITLIPERTFAVVVGPPVMYKFVLLSLDEAKVPRENIFLNLERKMKCGVGICGRCNVGPFYVCRDGPVLTWAHLQTCVCFLETFWN
jgi:hypothetical protein